MSQFRYNTTRGISNNGDEELETLEVQSGIAYLDFIVNGLFKQDAIWVKGTGWTIDNSKATHSAGTSSELNQPAALTVSSYIKFIFTVSGLTAGNVTPRISGGTNVDGVAITANGTYEKILKVVTGNNTLGFVCSSTFVGSISNVKVISCETLTSSNNISDISVNSDDLNVIGEVIKSAINVQSETVSFGNFANGNYIEQPYSANLDFATGDIGIIFWLRVDKNGSIKTVFDRNDTVGAAYFTGFVSASGVFNFQVSDGTTTRTAQTSVAVDDGLWRLISCNFASVTGSLSVYVNTILNNTVTGSVLLTINNALATFIIGLDTVLKNKPLTNGMVAFLKVVPGITQTQINTIHENESHLIKRLAPFRRVGDQYTLTAQSSVNQPILGKTGFFNRAIGGSIESFKNSDEDFIAVNSNNIELDDMPKWRDLIKSTDNQQTFTFLPGENFEPDEETLVSIEGSPTEQRQGSTRFHNIDFKLRVR